ncbi:UDP-N-acetylglucosamine transferase subunit [Exophiala xenobiotica]|nr:UDP-N-acetylglucosamine transferase subunit [Exophiala xenobiotica]
MDANRVQLSNPPEISSSSSSFLMTNFVFPVTSLTTTSQMLILLLVTILILLNIIFFRLVRILSRPPPSRRSQPSSANPTHILIVLGSGGHTAEMLNILFQTPCLQLDFTYRTYVVSSGDGFSALKAHELEKSLFADLTSISGLSIPEGTASNYDVATIHRARKVHQSIYTAPFSSLRCLLDCIAVLDGSHRDLKCRHSSRGYPDLILTNGPGTGVIVVLASLILLFFGYSGPSPAFTSTSKDSNREVSQPGGQMRSIFIESWARVKTLSLSGRLLKPFVNRFIVQWPQLARSEGSRVEYIGPLVT